MKPLKAIIAFLIDYIDRHKHPVNAILHIVGVPMVFYSLFEFYKGDSTMAAAHFVFGYLLQYLGHKAQGNEVGEVTLAKKIWTKITKTRKSHSSVNTSEEANIGARD